MLRVKLSHFMNQINISSLAPGLMHILNWQILTTPSVKLAQWRPEAKLLAWQWPKSFQTILEWLQDRFLNVTEWPSWNPDLSPFEHLQTNLNKAAEIFADSSHLIWQGRRGSARINSANPRLQIFEICTRRLKAVTAAKTTRAKYLLDNEGFDKFSILIY